MDTRRGMTIRFGCLTARREHQHIGNGANCQETGINGQGEQNLPTTRVVAPKRPLLVNCRARLLAKN